jgi:hypothetical protein
MGGFVGVSRIAQRRATPDLALHVQLTIVWKSQQWREVGIGDAAALRNLSHRPCPGGPADMFLCADEGCTWLKAFADLSDPWMFDMFFLKFA